MGPRFLHLSCHWRRFPPLPPPSVTSLHWRSCHTKRRVQMRSVAHNFVMFDDVALRLIQLQALVSDRFATCSGALANGSVVLVPASLKRVSEQRVLADDGCEVRRTTDWKVWQHHLRAWYDLVCALDALTITRVFLRKMLGTRHGPVGTRFESLDFQIGSLKRLKRTLQ